ncbi:uncharacterized protein LOC121741516 [Salvia splendens]|uniref:uncharacterized protein LOC121741516 n=1 Tax=Salvia splendens TaxID=180675 RepID=UPI001C26AD05|nr:uncharacterized protein LOC121741516 [Salvia splendens]
MPFNNIMLLYTNENTVVRLDLGNYFLYDNGYANAEGFLTPFKGIRYHLNEWGEGTQKPQNARELFNLRHSKARNIIERAFVVLKMRWGVLRSASFYPIKTQIRMIMACFLLHNFIRGEMTHDPVEDALDIETNGEADNNDYDHMEFVEQVEPITDWTQMQEDMAQSMWLNRGNVDII